MASTTSDSCDSYVRTLARVVAPPPTADALRADYYSRACAHYQERARHERHRAHVWRGRAGYALGAAIFFLGAYSGADWILAAGVCLVAVTVVIQSGRDGQ